MAKQLQLSIPEPCHEGWEKMTPSEKGRFCASCQKQVVDFSSMSDRQLAEFFKKPPQGSVCGHFQADQLDRAIDIPKKRIPWVKYFFQFTLPAFLLSLKASAQGSQGKTKAKTIKSAKLNGETPALVGVNNPMLCRLPLKIEPIIADTSRPMIYGDVWYGVVEDSRMVNGVVTNEYGEPLPGASVFLKGTKTGVVADMNGKFSIAVKDRMLTPTLHVSYVGYELLEIPVDRAINDTLKLQLRLRQDLVDGMVIVTRVVKKEIKNVPLMPAITEENNPGFKVFPNPASPGGILNIETKKLDAGIYSLLIVDQSGQSVYHAETSIEKRSNLLDIELPQVTAGSYFMVLVNKKTGKKHSQKIVIQ
jgi:hypothetical protein